MTANAIAADIRPGSWVRFGGQPWRYVQAARHTPFDPANPRITGFVQYDASTGPTGRCTLFGFSPEDRACRIVTVTPQAVTA